jgi:hypothetical protein
MVDVYTRYLAAVVGTIFRKRADSGFPVAL